LRTAFSIIGVTGVCLVLAGCDSGAPAASAPAVVLQARDLQQTRLSGEERKNYAALCRKTWDAAPQNRGKSADADTKTQRDLERVCDCFVDQLEDRTTKLEFLISMEVVRTANSAYGEPQTAHLEAAAAKLGLTRARFREIEVDARKVGAATIRRCVERVTSSG
jgi:hypothetical protein